MSDFSSLINYHSWETCQYPDLRDSWSCNTLPAPGCGMKAKLLLSGASKAYFRPLEIATACATVAGYIKQCLDMEILGPDGVIAVNFKDTEHHA